MYIETPPPTLFLFLSLNTCEYPRKYALKHYTRKAMFQ